MEGGHVRFLLLLLVVGQREQAPVLEQGSEMSLILDPRNEGARRRAARMCDGCHTALTVEFRLGDDLCDGICIGGVRRHDLPPVCPQRRDQITDIEGGEVILVQQQDVCRRVVQRVAGQGRIECDAFHQHLDIEAAGRNPPRPAAPACTSHRYRR